MDMVALFLMALALGWLGTLSLVRDLSRVEFTDFLIAAAGALSAGVLLPRLGFEVWGDNGLRISPLCAMAGASLVTLISANLIRGRGLRAGMVLSSMELPNATERRGV